MQSAAETSSSPHRTLGGIPLTAEAYALGEILAGHVGAAPASIVHVALNDRTASQLAATVSFFAPTADIVLFPAWDCLPYDRGSPKPVIAAERMRALADLAVRNNTKNPRILITTVNAVLQRVPPRSILQQSTFSLHKGERVNREKLIEFLQANGYQRNGKAIEPGEFAVRGGIIDLIPPQSTREREEGEATGLRLDFFGDDIESLRRFDPLTQLSQGHAEGITLHPAGEIQLTPESIERFRERYREAFGAVSKEDPLYTAISSGSRYPGIEHWLPLFYDKLDTLFDYTPDSLLTFGVQTEEALQERQESIRDYYEARIATRKAGDAPYNPLPPEELYLMQANWEVQMAHRAAIQLSPFEVPGLNNTTLHARPGINFAAVRATEITPFDQLKEYAAGQRVSGRATLLACLSAGSAERLQTLLSNHGVHAVRVEHWKEATQLTGKSIGIAVLPLETGFETKHVAIVSEQDLLGERIIKSKSKKRGTDVFMAEAANFLEGELVVHRDHGIGRFEGLVTLEVAGAKHDCLKLIYEGDDKLFLPVENIDLLSRFGVEDEGVTLDKLGAASWQSRKARMKERIKIAAEALLKTAAERLLKPAEIMQPDEKGYEAFTARFPYMETDDQERAIDDVLQDLIAGKPMDRLICGDVGFGKTEVALRAAFAAVSAKHHQVAVVVPTTLLARQHYKNFTERFAGFGFTVRQLSRMVPAKTQKETKQGLEEGAVDIVIGTHALLSKNIQFKNLGLVIVDEEQHFGVGQKEKLKELKSDVHVLTLSATPIPRTLQLSLSGVRDLSLITTPPVDRLSIRSFVMPYDPLVLREAILREQHRQGRTFFVTPRIQDIGDLKAKLAELVPEIKVGVAHGQMPPTDLDQVMNDFYDGKYDLLLSTAIIESGLDIPMANTIIIHRADRFGLGQLYQMRGRVGRGKIRAYAYFLLPPHKVLTKNATRRLEVMQSLDALGAGFTIASHDMDIRGCGNLVGEEQSGHIREVGVELYQQMLMETVEQLKKSARLNDNKSAGADAQDDSGWSPQINLGVSVLIPEVYVPDLPLRMGLYRRAGSLQTPEDIESFAAEMIDRFGPLPEETTHLLEVVRIKQLCRLAGVERIDLGPKGAVISFRPTSLRAPEKLLAHISRHPTTLKLRPDQKLIYMRDWGKAPTHQKIKEITEALHPLSKLNE